LRPRRISGPGKAPVAIHRASVRCETGTKCARMSRSVSVAGGGPPGPAGGLGRPTRASSSLTTSSLLSAAGRRHGGLCDHRGAHQHSTLAALSARALLLCHCYSRITAAGGHQGASGCRLHSIRDQGPPAKSRGRRAHVIRARARKVCAFNGLQSARPASHLPAVWPLLRCGGG
jgi:hypothetical protein